MIFDAGLCECFLAFAARAAYSAVVFSAFVATPCLGVVDVEVFSFGGYLRLGETGVGREELHSVPRTEMDGIIHRLDELRAAVGVDSMVSGMVRQHDVLQFVILGNARRNREHDAIPEGNDSRFHVFLIVVALGDGVRAL